MTLVIVVLIVFLIAMLGIGFLFKKDAKDLNGYFLSGRSLPTTVVIFTFAATWIGASATFGKSGLAYGVGLPAISSTIGSFLAFFIFTFFAGRIHRIGEKHNIMSIADLFYKRFGKTASLIAALVIAWTLIGTVGTQLIGSSKMLSFVFEPYGISYEAALIICVCIVVVYTVLSGLYGVAYTDVVQGLILLAVVGVIIPFASLSKAGGWEGLRANLDSSFFTMKLDMSLFGYLATSFLYFVAGPPYWQRAFASKSNKTARRGALGGNIIIVVYTVMVILIGMCAAVIYPNIPAAQHEMVILLLVRDYFPTILYAFTVAALLSVIMSTTDSYLILASQTITTDIYGRLAKKMDDKKAVFVSRLSVALVGVFALVFALSMKNVFQAMMLSMTYFAATVAVPALAAIFSRKVTRQAVIASMVTGFVSSIVWSTVLHNPWGISEAIAGSALSVVAIVLVSAMTQKQQPAVFLD